MRTSDAWRPAPRGAGRPAAAPDAARWDAGADTAGPERAVRRADAPAEAGRGNGRGNLHAVPALAAQSHGTPSISPAPATSAPTAASGIPATTRPRSSRSPEPTQR